jgi:hypothetical protein
MKSCADYRRRWHDALRKPRIKTPTMNTRFSSDFNDCFPQNMLDEAQDRADRRREHRYNLIAGLAMFIALAVLAWFSASVALGANIDLKPGANVQSTCDLANDGDTIIVYGTSANPVTVSNVTLRKQIHFVGAAVSYLKSAPNGYAFKLAANNLSFDGLTFDGNLFYSSDFAPDGLSITRCHLIGREGSGKPPGWPAMPNWAICSWIHSGAPTNMKFVGNDVGPVESWAAIFGFGGRDIEIAHNVLHDRQNPANPKTQGRFLKFFGDGANQDATFPEGGNNAAKLTSGPLLIHHNLFQRWRGMAIENQDGWLGNQYIANYYEVPIIVSNNREDHLDTWINSIVETRSVNMVSRENYYDARTPPGTPLVCFRVVEELGGFNFTSTDNYIILNGPNVGPDNSSNVSWAVNGTNCSGSIKNNRIVNGPGPVGSNLNPSKVNVVNNTATTALTWDINRPKPTTDIIPATQPSFAAALLVTSDTTAQLHFPLLPDVSTYVIQTKTSQGTDPWKTLGTVTTSPANIKQLKSGWEYSARVIADNHQVSTVANRRIGDVSLSTNGSPDNPALIATADPEPPTTQFVDDPVVEVQVKQKSGKVTVAKP